MRTTSASAAGTLRCVVVGSVAVGVALARGELSSWAAAGCLFVLCLHVHDAYWDSRGPLAERGLTPDQVERWGWLHFALVLADTVRLSLVKALLFSPGRYLVELAAAWAPEPLTFYVYPGETMSLDGPEDGPEGSVRMGLAYYVGPREQQKPATFVCNVGSLEGSADYKMIGLATKDMVASLKAPGAARAGFVGQYSNARASEATCPLPPAQCCGRLHRLLLVPWHSRTIPGAADPRLGRESRMEAAQFDRVGERDRSPRLVCAQCRPPEDCGPPPQRSPRIIHLDPREAEAVEHRVAQSLPGVLRGRAPKQSHARGPRHRYEPATALVCWQALL